MSRRSARQRRRNPSATTWAIAAAAGAATIAVVAGGVRWYQNRRAARLPSVTPTEPPRACDPSPYVLDAQVLQTVELMLVDEVRRGATDKVLAAQAVANELFGAHPNGELALFPPGTSPWPGVDCVWSIVVALTEDVFARGIQPSSEGLEWRLVTAADEGYPWEEPVLHAENYPTPSTWTNMGDLTGEWDPRQGFDDYVRALLGSALQMAGNDPQIAWAEGQDPRAEVGRELRRQVRQAVTAPGGVNDLLYGQTNLNYAGGNDPSKPGGNPNLPVQGGYVMNARGRGLNWFPRHADQLQRSVDGLALLRTTSLTGERLSGRRGGTKQMLVWGPAFDLALLAPGQTLRIGFLQWGDGSSTLDPPPVLVALGVDLQGVTLPGVST